MVEILRGLNREMGVTILLIEHVMRAVMALAGRVLVLHHGAPIAQGTPRGDRARSHGDHVLSRRGGGVLMLSVRDLDVFYGDAQALDGVSLRCRRRARIVAIVGANGAGKTSLIRTIAGMRRPARGRIRSMARRSPAGRAIASAISASARWRRAARSSRR